MRIKRIRLGFNPNSSSLSVDMSVLLLATTLATWGTFIVATAVRLWRRPKDAPSGKA
jgi:hypothetical protein